MTDIHLTITPNSMKVASKTLRALIRAKTGQDIPHSSVLNALTKGLGLGDNFGAMLAAHRPTPTRPHNSTIVLVAFPLTQAEMANQPNPQNALHTIVQNLTQNPSWDKTWIVQEAHLTHDSNNATIWVSHKGLIALPTQQNFLDTFANGAIAPLATLAARKGGFACAFHSGGDTRKLSVDFLYRNTGQVCTASVDENIWQAIHTMHIDPNLALPLVGYDCTIADDAIEVLDTRVDFGTLWNN